MTASWLSDIYDHALQAVRRSHPADCVVVLEVDAERLSARPSRNRLCSASSRRLTDRVAASPLIIDGEDLAAIERGEYDVACDPLRATLGRRLQLAGPAIGRLRLDGVVVALLVLDRASMPTTTADRLFVQHVAERASARMTSVLDVYLADVEGVCELVDAEGSRGDGVVA